MGLFKGSGVSRGVGVGSNEFALRPKGYRYNQLPGHLKRDYDTVCEGIQSFQKRIFVSGAGTREELDLLAGAVLMEQLQFFYVNPMQIGIVNLGGRYAFEFGYIYDRKSAAAVKEKIDENARFVLSQQIRDGMTDYEKVLAIHDYMTEVVQYNFSALSLDYVYDAHTIEGVFLKHRAVCEGIAKAVSYLLDMAGVPSIVVDGSSEIEGQGVNHAWNIVKLGDDYYHIDATWDLQEVNHFTSRSHMYVNLDDDSMVMNHDWNLENYPTCNKQKENYYVKEKRYFRTMRGFELFIRKFLEDGSENYLDVRFEDTLEIPDDGGRYIASIIQKTAAYLGHGIQLSFVFNAGMNVFQANVLIQ